MNKRQFRSPKLCTNTDGRAFSIWPKSGGHKIYFGIAGSAEAQAAYLRWCQRLLVAHNSGEEIRPEAIRSRPWSDLAGLSAQYLDWAETYYASPTGEPTDFGNILATQKHLMAIYADVLASEFGPNSLRGFQEYLVSTGMARTTINASVGRVRRFFRWCESRELVPPGFTAGLDSVMPLMPGKTAAPEPEPVQAVPWSTVSATLPFLPPPLRIASQVQYFCGMRPGEVLRMRACEIDRSRPVWIWQPPRHKTSHKLKTLTKAIPSRAQQLLQPLIDEKPAEAFLIDPADAAEWRKSLRPRKTTRFPCEVKRLEQKAKLTERRNFLSRYTTNRYEKEIAAAIQRAAAAKVEIEHWVPNQLRHAIATELRQLIGLHAAQAWLGHASIDTTQEYAKVQIEELQKIAARLEDHWK